MTNAGPAAAGETTTERLAGHVAAVLAAAEESAEQMRAEAREEAERVIGEAREWAAGILTEAEAEAERVNAEAAAYANEVRTSGDEYAAGKRRDVDGEILPLVEAANEQAVVLRDQARREAAELVESRRRRNEAIAAEARDDEERLTRLHALLAEMTEQLAEMAKPGLPKQIMRPSAQSSVPDHGQVHSEPTRRS
jgi:hypothetical protein